MAARRVIRAAVTPEHWDRIKILFDEAVALPPARRADFVEKVCVADEDSGRALKELLSSAEGAGSLDRPLVDFHRKFDLNGLTYTPATTTTTTAAPVSLRGQILADRYRLIRHVGKGGMGEVYEAEDLRLRQRVALKTIRPEIADDPVVVSRFKSEIVMALKVAHSNVCRIHGLGIHKWADGGEMLFLTMEFLEGETLAVCIKRGRLDPAEALPLIVGMADGLLAAHRAGVIHRDFKSANVMLAPDDGGTRAVITDFGLARPSSPAVDRTAITRIGTFAGTPHYMSPEQINGLPLTPAADIYALGVVVYELVTGRLPFTGDSNWAILLHHLNDPPPQPRTFAPNLDERWETAILGCLKKAPGERFQSAEEFKAALSAEAKPATGAPPGRETRLHRPRARLKSGIAAVACLAGLLTAGVLWYESHSYERPSPDAQRWYKQGVDAIHAGTYFKATRALTRAIELDKQFVLAHARLAEAWSELDFEGKAKDEMLLASSLETRRGVPAADRDYLDAIRSTITYDYATAVNDYRNILGELSEREKPFGYVDLGRAREKAANLPEALKDYKEASRLASEDPASFVHIGIIESRQGNTAGGEDSFKHAESLYSASGDDEGTAEIAYQRGYVASLTGDFAHAREELARSIELAKALRSPQLEIRSLIRESTVEYLVKDVPRSIELANRSIQLARENGLDYWAADGLARIGNAWLAGSDYRQAEQPLQEALKLASEGGRQRVLALAELSLASSRNLQDKPDESIDYAQKAFAYYKPAGFLNESANALTLIARSERDKADFRHALAHALDEIEILKKANNRVSLLQAEESVGSILLDMEQYPEALTHFEAALAAARSVHRLVEYQLLHCADALWHLGRYSEAESMLAQVPVDLAASSPVRESMDLLRARMQLSRKQYGASLASARLALARKDLDMSLAAAWALVAGAAAQGAGAPQSANSFCEEARDWAQKAKAPADAARADLCEADALTAARLPQNALPFAESAVAAFKASGQQESEWRASLSLARIHKALGDVRNSRQNASAASETIAMTERGWGSSFQTYAVRPDVEKMLRELSDLTNK
jgi:eukaryotic-like serine/threonine-protein kinase